jgi:GH18 family chitinase
MGLGRLRAESSVQNSHLIFRNAVFAGNRENVAKNIADFVRSDGLDGLDIDWEYPAAQDLPDIPSAPRNEGELYLEFLKSLKRLLLDKSVSFAAPAGYWYLKGFPINQIASVVDYLV